MPSPEIPDSGNPPLILKGSVPLILSPRHKTDDNILVGHGIDLYVLALSGREFRYLVHEWSVVSGEEDRFMPVPEEFAVFYVQEICSRYEKSFLLDHERIVKFLPELYENER